jgi:predicted RNase H-like HicB family nuclease
MRDYVVIYEKGESGWGAYAPDLPGLGAAGKTLEEVKQLIAEGVVFHLEGLLEDNDAIPEPTTLAGIVSTDIVETWQGRLAKSA